MGELGLGWLEFVGIGVVLCLWTSLRIMCLCLGMYLFACVCGGIRLYVPVRVIVHVCCVAATGWLHLRVCRKPE
jgi:hypothetical protein